MTVHPDANPFSARHPNADVRMRGFVERATTDAALAWLEGQLPEADRAVAAADRETVPLSLAAGRVLAEDLVGRVDVPGFARAMMDGFALCATDTYGASAYNRLPLAIVGDCFPGQPSTAPVRAGSAVRIMTGAPLPEGADAVLPAEHTQVEGQKLLVLGEVSPGKHVGLPGEDVAAGTRLLARGRRLRPQDLGLISSVGIDHVAVVRRPTVRLVITGDELLPAGSPPAGFQIADANGPMLLALVERDGGVPIFPGLVADNREAILDALRTASDIVLVSGGSSVGQEDHVPTLLAEHGELAIHGVAMRPSSPVGLGRLKSTLIFLLPGNPVSCLCAYDFFAGRAIRALGGRTREWPYRTVQLPLARKLVSVVGRLDYARVTIEDERVEPLTISGASVLSTTTRADGFVLIAADSEGYAAGEQVTVYRYDE